MRFSGGGYSYRSMRRAELIDHPDTGLITMTDSKGDQRHAPRGEPGEEGTTPGPATILVVDDDPVARSMMVDMLRLQGYRTIAVGAGEELFAHLGKIDLVLLDAMLPGRDGWSVCHELKEKYDPLLPVIMVTARAATADMARAFEAHADDFVTKPFQPVELMARIESRLRVRRLEQELQELAAQNYALYREAASHAAEKEALLRELDHRVRNNLAVITGLASLERCRRPARSASEALASLENRFRIFLLAFDISKRHGGLTVPIRQIVEPVIQRLRNAKSVYDRIEIGVGGEAQDLCERQALALALIVHEVVSNAIEHAFADGHSGEISVQIEETGTDTRVSVRDNGVGFVPDELPQVLGSGCSIVRALVHGDLAGSVTYDSGISGTTVTISFPKISDELGDSDPWSPSSEVRGDGRRP